jgi:hypothetical protein
LKRFDGDYDILYQNVKNLKLKSGKTFEETLLSYGKLPFGESNSASGATSKAVETYLNIYVYTPKSTPESWNTESVIPKITITPDIDIEQKGVLTPALDANGVLSYLDPQKDPDEIVLVVGYNERLDENGKVKEHTSLAETTKKPLQTRAAYRTAGGLEDMWQLNIPNLSAIETWQKGSPELRCVSYTQEEGPLADDAIWGVDRVEFEPWKWYQWNKNMIGGWFPQIQGNFVMYHWYEDDPSWILLPYRRNHSFIKQSGSVYDYSIRVGGQDDILGFDKVNFTDITWKDYRASNGDKSMRWYMGPF